VYRILIAQSADILISSWDLPDEIRAQMEQRLRNDLAADPINCLVRVDGLSDEKLNVYSFTIPEPPVPGSTYIFWFHFVYGEDEKSLHLLDADYEGPESTSGGGVVL